MRKLNSNYWCKLFFVVSFMLIVNPSILKPQEKIETESLKNKAQLFMYAKKYDEAIDLLNKYIIKEPTQADAYNLRAICFEEKGKYEIAKLDFRRALVLEAGNPMKYYEYERNLKKLTDKWYSVLETKIKDYKSKFETDTNNPSHYLEIGKAYNLMEAWDKAEQWYEEYLKRGTNVPADEVLRYSEILSRTAHVAKGEKILKKYIEIYPGDWRLLSRYGYFTMWQNKIEIAKNAFETVLKSKPFFKEAQDGLDMVNKLMNREL